MNKAKAILKSEKFKYFSVLSGTVLEGEKANTAEKSASFASLKNLFGDSKSFKLNETSKTGGSKEVAQLKPVAFYGVNHLGIIENPQELVESTIPVSAEQKECERLHAIFANKITGNFGTAFDKIAKYDDAAKAMEDDFFINMFAGFETDGKTLKKPISLASLKLTAEEIGIIAERNASLGALLKSGAITLRPQVGELCAAVATIKSENADDKAEIKSTATSVLYFAGSGWVNPEPFYVVVKSNMGTSLGVTSQADVFTSYGSEEPGNGAYEARVSVVANDKMYPIHNGVVPYHVNAIYPMIKMIHMLSVIADGVAREVVVTAPVKNDKKVEAKK